MVSTDAAKRALAALAARTDTARGPYVAVVDEAAAARSDLSRAVGFLDNVGLDRLAAAVETAETAGDADAATRGRDALEAYRRLQRAAAGDDAVAASADATDERERADAPSDPRTATPGTHKRRTGQGSS